MGTQLSNEVEAVRAVLQRFQDGYTRRSLDNLNEFMTMFVSDDTLEVIGTGALKPGEFEWCLGLAATRELVENDWKGWGDLVLDVQGARIYTSGDAAWLATNATVNMTIPAEQGYADHISYLRARLAEETPAARDLLLDIVRGGSNTLFEFEQGEHFVWPLRFTAVLVRREGRWLFHQMQFSHANTRFPDERL